MKDQIIQNSFPLKLIEHLGQVVSNKEFAFFDLDNSEWNLKKKSNQEIYGDEQPPTIKLSDITEVPIIIYAGTKDSTVDLEDARWTKN